MNHQFAVSSLVTNRCAKIACPPVDALTFSFSSHNMFPSITQMLPSGSLYHQIHDPVPVLDKYYVHEPSVKVPKNLCLAGFVFHLHGFQQDAGKNFILNDMQRKYLKDRIIRLGGEFESEYSDKVTHVFTDSQKYAIAERAVREGKRLINIYWLDDVLKEEKMRPPWRAWHLPRSAIHPTAIIKTQIIATTGFSLPERQFIRELCCFIGAKYTPYMSQSNTILICKQVDSEKYAKAIDWLIPIVSGHWIVDVFFNVNDSLRMPFGSAHQRHKNFDSADPFEIDFRAVRQLMSGWTKPVRVDPERLAKMIELKSQQIDQQSQNSQNSNCSGSTIIISSSQTLLVSSADSSNTEIIGDVIPSSQPPDVGQENRKLVNGSENNSNSMNDDDVFMKPAAKKPRLSVDAGSRSPVIGLIPPPPPLQLAPNVPLPETAVRVMFTGFKSDYEDLIDIVQKLGGKVTTNHRECTHIVVESTPTRTVKYLLALNFAQHVVHQKWLTECKKMNRFVSEQEHGFRSSKDAIRRREERGPENGLLFRNMVLHITAGCVPSPSLLKTMVDFAGGVGVTSVGPTRKQLTALRYQGFDFHVVTCPSDLHLCGKFKEWGIRLMHPEFILTSLMRQEMDFEDGSFDVKPDQES